MLRLFIFCAVAVFGSAAPQSVFTGTACPYIMESDCSIKTEIEPECFTVNFGDCVRFPKHYLTFYERTYYDHYRENITFQRYTDAECLNKDPAWHNPAWGVSGQCIGPIAQVQNLGPQSGPIYLRIYVDHHPQ